MGTKEVRIQPPQAFLIQLVIIFTQWAFGAWLLPVLHMAPATVPLRWAVFLVCIALFLLSKKWMVKFFAKHNANPMFKEHAKELITEFPFSVARNPFYLLDFMPFLGLTILLDALDPLLLHFPLFFSILELLHGPRRRKTPSTCPWFGLRKIQIPR